MTGRKQSMTQRHKAYSEGLPRLSADSIVGHDRHCEQEKSAPARLARVL
ncbi:MAG: hypothetical protein Q7T96_10500 [Methylobacter sp.]|nr:hypothetical protein [Methylobacter sp.]